MKTGWPPGLLQDDDRKLSCWLASRPDARYQLRKNIMEKQPEAIRLADWCRTWNTTMHNQVEAELRRQHAEIERLTKFCDELICELSGLRMAASMQKKIDALKEQA